MLFVTVRLPTLCTAAPRVSGIIGQPGVRESPVLGTGRKICPTIERFVVVPVPWYGYQAVPSASHLNVLESTEGTLLLRGKVFGEDLRCRK